MLRPLDEHTKTITLLDLKLGNLQLSDEQKATIRQKIVPIFAQAALRLIAGGYVSADSAENKTPLKQKSADATTGT